MADDNVVDPSIFQLDKKPVFAPPLDSVPAEVFQGFGDPVAKAVGSVGSDPNRAAKSIDLSKETGTAPEIINADQEAFVHQKACR